MALGVFETCPQPAARRTVHAAMMFLVGIHEDDGGDCKQTSSDGR
jgi:hypothetical protein